jgi:hypothetical protein
MPSGPRAVGRRPQRLFGAQIMHPKQGRALLKMQQIRCRPSAAPLRGLPQDP